MQVDKEVLGFQKPFTVDVVKCELELKNPSNDEIQVFKIKTTAPKTYCVRPNSGLILPLESKIIQVILQPMEQDPPDDFKSKDKFLIMSVPVSAAPSNQSIIDMLKENSSSSDIWTLGENNASGKVKEQKLRVAYLPSASTSSTLLKAPLVSIGSAADGTQHQLQISPSKSPSPGPTSTNTTNANINQNTMTNNNNNSYEKKNYKMEQMVKEKEEEIKRLQMLVKQYKNTSKVGGKTPNIYIIVLVAIFSFLFSRYFFK